MYTVSLYTVLFTFDHELEDENYLQQLCNCSIFSVNIDQLKMTQLELEKLGKKVKRLESMNTDLLQENTMLQKANGKFVVNTFCDYYIKI